MKAVFGLLAVLAGVSHGVETYMYCNATQDEAQCYGALGGTVDLQLLTKATEESVYELYMILYTNEKLLKTRRTSCIIVHDSIKNRASCTFYNATLRISNISRTDAAEYRFEYREDGTLFEPRRINMSVEAPVSSLLLSSECSRGEKRVFCSSKGDSLRYSWTLDGQPLKDTVIISGNNESRDITLNRGLSGRLVCSVKNHVSSADDSESILPCEGLVFINCTLTNGSHISDWVLQPHKIECVTTAAPTPPTEATTTKEHITIIAATLVAVVFLLLLLVGVYCAQMRRRAAKAPGLALECKDNEDDVTYANVRILKGQQRQKEKKAEMEVEYGQVKVSGGPRQTAEPSEDECVYAKVRVGQRR